MRRRHNPIDPTPFAVTIDKMVHGGQALGTMPDGRKVFVWNALPGETVSARLIKVKKSYAEAIAESVVGNASPDRVEPLEDNYLSTSPWQIMSYEAENRYKREIVAELFEHERVILPEFGAVVHGADRDSQWYYRNKMEYSFWGDDDGLHLALHQRGSHGKQIVQGSRLALPAVDAAANAICTQLSTLHGGTGARAGDLKTIIVRCDQSGRAVGSLFTKLDTFPRLALPPELAGLRVYHSNPLSPASVPTRLLYELGDNLLHDELLGKPFVYDADSFFQVNLPVFEQALGVIRNRVAAGAGRGLTDMYSGVGSIGLSVAMQDVTLVELDPACVRMAAHNAAVHEQLGEMRTVQVIEASTENALEYIRGDTPVIFDPPRAGLHDRVVARVLDQLPPQIIYLSCNPATHARDLARLQTAYIIEQFQVFNFFPRTPHIETLAVLTRRASS